MKSLVQELRKEEEAEQREKATNKQNDAGTSNVKSNERSTNGKTRKARKCNVSLNKPISLDEYADDEEDESDEDEIEMNNKTGRNESYAKNPHNEHDYFSISNGKTPDDESEQILEINGELVKGAQIVLVDGKELNNDDGEQVATIVYNGNGELVAEVV